MIALPTVKIPTAMSVSFLQFQQLVKANPDLRLELTVEGKLIAISPTGSEGGQRNAELTTDFVIWNRQTKLGIVFDSSTGFKLPNGAVRSPDVSWVQKSRWDALTPEQRKGFAPLCPDFVLELASESDDIGELQLKMQEYMANGSQLGWLIDPRTQQVDVYRPGKSVEILQSPKILSGEDILFGLLFNLDVIYPD